MSDERRDCRGDLDLARRAGEGDGAAWRQIVDASCDRLFALLCFQLGSREDAFDLLQETYLAAIRRIGAYRGEAPLGAWLRSIALRKAIDWKRTMLRRIKRTIPLAESIPSGAASPDHGARFESERVALDRALASLSPLQRAVFLLREWEEWSFAEIARAVGCREGTARVHHTRARERLRRRLRSRFPMAFPAEGLEGRQS